MQELYYHEIVELIDDEESEVFSQACKTYIKHMGKIFTKDFNQSLENINVIKKILSISMHEMTPKEV